MDWLIQKPAKKKKNINYDKVARSLSCITTGKNYLVWFSFFFFFLFFLLSLFFSLFLYIIVFKLKIAKPNQLSFSWEVNSQVYDVLKISWTSQRTGLGSKDTHVCTHTLGILFRKGWVLAMHPPHTVWALVTTTQLIQPLTPSWVPPSPTLHDHLYPSVAKLSN